MYIYLCGCINTFISLSLSRRLNNKTMEISSKRALLLVSTIVLYFAAGVHSIGVNYGTLGDNLPPPAQVAAFLKQNTIIDRVKIFDANPDIIRAFANTGIALTVTVPNGDIPALTNVRVARRWVGSHIKPFYPATQIAYLSVGSEVLHWGDTTTISSLVPAMKALYVALVKAGLGNIKVSTPHSLGILVPSDHPSAGRFRPDIDQTILAPMLQFLRKTKSPFMVNPYPYFGYNPKNPDFSLFRSITGIRDRYTGKVYMDLYDQLLDSVYSAMKKLGYGDVSIVVAETGWPSLGEPFLTHVTVENARWHNLNVFRKASSGAGTPLMPGRKFETYIFALFNENQKPGSIAEKNFGLFRPDFSPVYDIGIMRTQDGGVKPQPTPALPAPNKKWCVAKAGVSNSALQANIDYVCRNGIDCTVIQPGGACFEPNTVQSHAVYVMNAWYQTKGRHVYDCDFTNTGVLVSSDPSYGACKYMS